jgi:hypothetical protein
VTADSDEVEHGRGRDPGSNGVDMRAPDPLARLADRADDDGEPG